MNNLPKSNKRVLIELNEYLDIKLGIWKLECFACDSKKTVLKCKCAQAKEMVAEMATGVIPWYLFPDNAERVAGVRMKNGVMYELFTKGAKFC